MTEESTSKEWDPEDILGHSLYGLVQKPNPDDSRDSKRRKLEEVGNREGYIFAGWYERRNLKEWLDSGSGSSTEISNFVNMKKGDYVVVVTLGEGNNKIANIGRVLSDYGYDKKDCKSGLSEFPNYRKVDWVRMGLDNAELSRVAKFYQLNRTLIKKERRDKINFVKYLKGESIMKHDESDTVLNSKNVIFRGAPGTGKTYLAKQIAADIISGGETDDITKTENVPKDQWDFVQFHPSYDYTDFVEGLRPHTVEVKDEEGNLLRKDISFELEPGIFKKFCDEAREQYDSDLKQFRQGKKKSESDDLTEDEKNEFRQQMKKYVFIIDEINRGEISKIFGELFFSIDPGYRGPDGEVSTQYSNMNGNKKFYIPENVYIIGTMNDIDRSVDTFDFAMRRRFRFVEVTAEISQNMLDEVLKDDQDLPKIKNRMTNLNNMISSSEIGLNPNYHIGASYFIKLNELDGTKDEKFEALWEDYLKPLLEEYLRGMSDEKGKIGKLKDAYDNDKAPKNTTE